MASGIGPSQRPAGMKLYTRDKFMALPDGVFFVKMAGKWANQDLCIKGETIIGREGLAIDFYEQPLNIIDFVDTNVLVEQLEEMLEAGASYPYNQTDGRDGMFDDGDMFLVYEREDLAGLADQIRTAIEVSPT
jgi:hypothetical protein